MLLNFKALFEYSYFLLLYTVEANRIIGQADIQSRYTVYRYM